MGSIMPGLENRIPTNPPPSLVVMVAMNSCYGMLVILQTCHLRTSSELIPNISPKSSVLYGLLDSFLSVFSVLPPSPRDAAPNHALSRVCGNLSFSRCCFYSCFWPQRTF